MDLNEKTNSQNSCILLAGALLCGSGSAAFGVTSGELSQLAPTREALQEQALEQYASLLDSFKMSYPDYYAGAYLNDEDKLDHQNKGSLCKRKAVFTVHYTK